MESKTTPEAICVLEGKIEKVKAQIFHLNRCQGEILKRLPLIGISKKDGSFVDTTPLPEVWYTIEKKQDELYDELKVLYEQLKYSWSFEKKNDSLYEIFLDYKINNSEPC